MNRKLVFSLFLVIGLVLVLNLSTLTAANATSNTAPKVISVNPVNNSIILKSQTVKVYFNEPIKAGTMSIALKNSAGTTIATKKIISNRTLCILPSITLPTGVKYNLILNSGSVKDLTGKSNSYYSTSFTVSPITLAQMKDGLSRAQAFYNTNLRLPSYVSFNTKSIKISEFQKIIATQGLKINTNIKDLIVTQVTAPSFGIKGNTITVPNTIKNQGNTATGGFYVRFYLISNSSISIGQRYISSLAAGASNSQNTKLSIPINITSSGYYIDVYADSSKIVTESKENNNYRYSTTKIQITDSSTDSRPIYLTSDNIINPDTDMAKLNNIVSSLKAMGLYAVNYGLGPNSHYEILKNVAIPENALIVNIYGGVCAGTIWEMTLDYYTNLVRNRSVFSIWINTKTNIDNLNNTLLPRSNDDTFTPKYGTFRGFPNWIDSDQDGVVDSKKDINNDGIYEIRAEDGIINPAQLLKQYGYNYLYQQNGDIASIVSSIYKEATSNL